MIEWIISSTVLILLVIILRTLFKGKINLKLQYAIWLLVLFRLLIPGHIGNSHISFANLAPSQSNIENTFIEPVIVEFTGQAHVPEFGIKEANEALSIASSASGKQINIADVLEFIWIGGVFATAMCIIISNLSFYGKLRRSRRTLDVNSKLPVYRCKWLETPCLFGFFKPAIYISRVDNEMELRHILCHESMHYRQGDHIWSLLRSVCLALHWYNPLVWAASILSRRDAELACDEAVIKAIGREERMEYGRTLLRMTIQGQNSMFNMATSMNNSKKGISERVYFIAKAPRMRLYSLFAVLFTVAVIAACGFVGADSKEEIISSKPIQTETPMQSAEPEKTVSIEPQPSKYKEIFYNNDGDVEFVFDFEVPEMAEVMPIVGVQARDLTIGDGKKIAQAIFGTSEIYERTKNYFMGTWQEIPTKEAIDEFLDYGLKLQADEKMLKEVCGTDYEIMPDLVSSLIETYGDKSYYDAAISDNERNKMQWEFKPDDYTPHLNRILGSYEKNGLRYRFLMTNGDTGDGVLKNVLVTIENSNLAYMNLQKAYFERSSQELPNTDQLIAAQEEAVRIMNEIDPGKWKIDKCIAQQMHNNRYIIQIEAQPVYASWPVIKQDNFKVLFDCEEIYFEFGVDGSLLYMCYKNPMEEIERSDNSETLSLKAAMSFAMDYLKQVPASEYDYWVTGPDGLEHDGVRSKVFISDVQQGWLRVPVDGEEKRFTMQPVVSFIGYFESFDENGEETSWSEFRPNTPTALLNISALDGSVLRYASETVGTNGLPRN